MCQYIIKIKSAPATKAGADLIISTYSITEQIRRPDRIRLHPFIHLSDSFINPIAELLLRQKPPEPFISLIEPSNHLRFLRLPGLAAIEPFSFDCQGIQHLINQLPALLRRSFEEPYHRCCDYRNHRNHRNYED